MSFEPGFLLLLLLLLLEEILLGELIYILMMGWLVVDWVWFDDWDWDWELLIAGAGWMIAEF